MLRQRTIIIFKEIDASGTFAIGNAGGGIDLHSSSYNHIGGNNYSPGADCTGECNLISGNPGDNGVSIFESGAVSNTVSGNYIGTDVSGTAPIPNGDSGVIMSTNAQYNVIGGPTAGERNIITYNGGDGIAIWDSGATNNVIENNWIGIDADSTGGIDPRDLVVADDGTVFLSNYGQGVFKSTDNTNSWQGVNNGLSTLNIKILAVAPDFAASQRLWAWGEGMLFASTDAGANWSLVNNTLPGSVKDLAAAPNYTTTPLLLATVDETSNWTDGGIYRSADGGATWTQVYSIWYVSRLAFSPNFATDGLALANAGNGAARSTDGGLTWNDSSSGIPTSNTSDLAFTPDGSAVFLASHGCGSDEGVYHSDNGGQTWTASGTGLSDCGSDRVIAVSPNFAVDQTLLVIEDQFFRSQDAGASWQWANDGAFGSRGVAIAFSPDFAVDHTAYRVSFAGSFRTVDGGSTWAWAGANLADRGNSGSGIQISNVAGPNQILGNRSAPPLVKSVKLILFS